MKIDVAVESVSELSQINLEQVSSIVISPKGLSRFGKISIEEAMALIEAATRFKKGVIVEWDTYCHQSEQDALFYSFKQFYQQSRKYNNPRLYFKVCDLGIALFCAQKFEDINLHLNLETSFHNLPSILALAKHEIIGPKVKRISLSLELSWATLKKIAEALHALNIEIDLLIFGRILLFSTPRELLTPHFEEMLKIKEELLIEGNSEESPHKGFPIYQNKKGTFMFNTKDLCLFDVATKCEELGLDFALLDFRFESDDLRTTLINQSIELLNNFNDEAFSKLKEKYPRPTTRGFFLTNKSDVLLPKLKNSRLQGRHENMIGQIVDVDRDGGRMAVLLRDPKNILEMPINIKVVSPVGKEKSITLNYFEDADKNRITTNSGQHVFFIPWISSMTTRSNVFLLSDS